MIRIPLILTIVFLLLLRQKKKRVILPIITLIYLIAVLAVAIIPSLFEMTATGQGDPQLVAGQISENLVTSILLMILDIPIIALLFFWLKRSKTDGLKG